jgi:hypothetical protein
MLHCNNMVGDLSLILLDIHHIAHFRIAAMQHKTWRNYRRGPTCQLDGPRHKGRSDQGGTAAAPAAAGTLPALAG